MSDPTLLSSGPAPLGGALVLDMTRALAGPHAAMMLGDIGARVIGIESPDGGDDSRGWGPLLRLDDHDYAGGRRESTAPPTLGQHNDSIRRWLDEGDSDEEAAGSR